MKIQLHDRVIKAILTTEHSASAYGLPVLVIEGEAYGPADIIINGIRLIEASPDEIEQLKKAGYWPAIASQRRKP